MVRPRLCQKMTTPGSDILLIVDSCLRILTFVEDPFVIFTYYSQGMVFSSFVLYSVVCMHQKLHMHPINHICENCHQNSV